MLVWCISIDTTYGGLKHTIHSYLWVWTKVMHHNSIWFCASEWRDFIVEVDILIFVFAEMLDLRVFIDSFGMNVYLHFKHWSHTHTCNFVKIISKKQMISIKSVFLLKFSVSIIKMVYHLSMFSFNTAHS